MLSPPMLEPGQIHVCIATADDIGNRFRFWPHLATLAAMTVVFLVLGSALFRWRFA